MVFRAELALVKRFTGFCIYFMFGISTRLEMPSDEWATCSCHTSDRPRDSQKVKAVWALPLLSCPKPPLILHTDQGPAVNTPAGAGRGFQPFFKLMAEVTQFHKGTPLSRARETQPDNSAAVSWGKYLSQTLHSLFSALSFCSHKRTPFPG